MLFVSKIGLIYSDIVLYMISNHSGMSHGASEGCNIPSLEMGPSSHSQHLEWCVLRHPTSQVIGMGCDWWRVLFHGETKMTLSYGI